MTEGRRHARYRQVPKRTRNDGKTSAPASPSTKKQKRSENSAHYAPLLDEETAETQSLNIRKSRLKSQSDFASTTDIRSTKSMKFVRLPSLRSKKGSSIPTSFLTKLTLKLKRTKTSTQPKAPHCQLNDESPSVDVTLKRDNVSYNGTTGSNNSLDRTFLPTWDDAMTTENDMSCNTTYLSMNLEEEFEREHEQRQEYLIIEDQCICRSESSISIPSLSLFLDDEDVALTYVQDDLMNEDACTQTIRFSDSIDSIPSLLSDGDNAWDQAPAYNGMLDPTNTKDAADSAIAWGCLVALLGSPAPRSVRKQKKQAPVTALVEDDINDCILPQGDNDGLENDLQALNLNIQYEDTSDDISIPSCGDFAPDVVVDNFLTTPTRAQRGIADSTLAWSIVGAILGSPAPSVVSKKRSARKLVTLLDDSNADDDSSVPEIEDQHDLNEALDMTELVQADEDAIDTAVKTINMEKGGDGNDNAESVLAWTALGMLLGSPAPKFVCKTKIGVGSVLVAKNLWKDFDAAAGNDHSNEIPVISIDIKDINPFFIECRTSAQCWLDGCSQDQDCVPSLSRSMSGASDGEDGYSL